MPGRAVFLDRDGVLNRALIRAGKPYPPASLAELEIVPEVALALARLKRCGLALLVITNQPDVARGTQSRAVVEAINQHLQQTLPLDKIYTCYHDDQDACSCRKPQPGLILQAARDWQVDPASSFMIGDRWKDVAAGRAAQCTTFLIDQKYAEVERATPHYRVNNLSEAAYLIEQLLGKKLKGVESGAIS